MKFEWDENKYQLNIHCHEIDFCDACKVFDYPTLRRIDNRKDYGEIRYVALGQLDKAIVSMCIPCEKKSSESFPSGGLTAVNVKHTGPISMSRTNWKKLRQSEDRDIDYTDNPPTDENFWESAEVVMPTHKTHLSVRFDDDVVEYFKKKGRGYQSMMNAVLRSYMNSHIKKHAC